VLNRTQGDHEYGAIMKGKPKKTSRRINKKQSQRGGKKRERERSKNKTGRTKQRKKKKEKREKKRIPTLDLSHDV